jgi:VIT1/CCC1 family predicted Fe2+/Mn2+ transporter
MSNQPTNFSQRIIPLIGVIIGIIIFLGLFIVGLFFLSYFVIIGAVVFFVLFILGFIRKKLIGHKTRKQQPAPPTEPDDKKGRTIEHDEQ